MDEYILDCISSSVYCQVSRFSIFPRVRASMCALPDGCTLAWFRRRRACNKKRFDSSPSLTIYCFTRFHVTRLHFIVIYKNVARTVTNMLRIVKYHVLRIYFLLRFYSGKMNRYTIFHDWNLCLDKSKEIFKQFRNLQLCNFTWLQKLHQFFVIKEE